MSIIIEKIQFQNYRQYGTGGIRFNTGNNSKLSVLVAKNGTGKTTLLNSITWCLYEKEQQLIDKKSALSVVSTAELEKASEGAFITVSVAVSIVDGNKTIEFKREQRFKKVVNANNLATGIAGASSFTASTTVDGKFENTRIDTGLDADLVVKKYFDLAIFDFYFFDGEKLKEFFSSERTGHIKASIYNIAQVTLLQNAYEHVEKMRTEKMRLMGKNNPDLSKLTDEQEGIKQQKELALQTIEVNTVQKNKKVEKREQLDDILRGYAPIKRLQEERSRLELSLKKCDVDKLTLDSDRSDVIRKYTVLIKLYPRMKQALHMIQIKEASGDLPPVVDRNLIKKVLSHLDEPCPLCAGKIGETGRMHLEEMLEKISVSSKTSNYLKEIKGSLEMYVEDAERYPKVRDAIKQREIDLDARINKIENRLKEINATLVNYSDGNGKINVSAVEKERDNLSKQISAADISIGSATQAIKTYDATIAGLQKKIDEATKKMGTKDVLKQQTRVLVKIEDSFKKIKDSITDNMRNEIESITWNIFDSMIWKHNTFGKISIEENYDVAVYNKEGNVMTGSLSATEQMALAYAFTLAIHNASGKNCPLVIDSPLGRVSDDNRENMAKALLNISEKKQIIMLFTPDEFSDSVRTMYTGVADVRVLQLSSDEKHVEGIEN